MTSDVEIPSVLLVSLNLPTALTYRISGYNLGSLVDQNGEESTPTESQIKFSERFNKTKPKKKKKK